MEEVLYNHFGYKNLVFCFWIFNYLDDIHLELQDKNYMHLADATALKERSFKQGK